MCSSEFVTNLESFLPSQWDYDVELCSNLVVSVLYINQSISAIVALILRLANGSFRLRLRALSYVTHMACIHRQKLFQTLINLAFAHLNFF